MKNENEAKARRIARKHGFSAVKSRGALSVDNHGGFMLVENDMNACVQGSQYDLTAEDVIAFFKEVA